jgi:RNA polymerase sigma-70 factor (ECF subfamily)
MNGQRLAGTLPLAMQDRPEDRLGNLFDAHHERLYRLARRLAANADDALDLVQETFLRAARSPGSVPLGASAEEAWLVRVLINLHRDAWRKAAVRKRHAQRADPPTRVEATQEAALIARTTIWRALDRLPSRRRAVVVLHELEGLSISAIASLLGLSRITVRWHLAMGRRDLTRILTSPSGDLHVDHQ